MNVVMIPRSFYIFKIKKNSDYATKFFFPLIGVTRVDESTVKMIVSIFERDTKDFTTTLAKEISFNQEVTEQEEYFRLIQNNDYRKSLINSLRFLEEVVNAIKDIVGMDQNAVEVLPTERSQFLNSIQATIIDEKNIKLTSKNYIKSFSVLPGNPEIDATCSPAEGFETVVTLNSPRPATLPSSCLINIIPKKALVPNYFSSGVISWDLNTFSQLS